MATRSTKSTTRKQAAAKRAAADVDHDEIIDALEREKAGYEKRNLPDRAKAVQSEITKHRAAAKKEGSSSGSSSKPEPDGSKEGAPRTNRGSAKASTGAGDAAEKDATAAAGDGKA